MEPVTVSGPSVLGLNAESQEQDSVSYLLEDEPRSQRGRFVMLFLLVVLMLGGGAYFAYQKYYLSAAFGERAPLGSVPAFAYERTPPALLEAAIEPELPRHSLRDQLALENIAAVMRATTASDRSAALLAQGEKYLYGRGVITNCELARKNLEGAADGGNPSAMAHLGSMYGSGRCAQFSRVKAYQWFRKAKDADPNNTWIESSMDMLWRNMSRTERAAILK
jgi:TPR repeat protein